jgi:hypothetical protein
MAQFRIIGDDVTLDGEVIATFSDRIAPSMRERAETLIEACADEGECPLCGDRT